MMKEKVILTDCDGVLVDWVHGFTKWMDSLGYKRVSPDIVSYDMEIMFGIDREECKKLVKHFNTSADMRISFFICSFVSWSKFIVIYS